MTGSAIEPGIVYKAALYIRLSKEDMNQGPSESVTNQLSLLGRFAEEKGIEVYDRYIDDGFSGTNFQRPGFQRMVCDIEAGLVNMVVTKDLSRLGRDYIMTGYYLERYFPEHGVRYISLLDGIDTAFESAMNDITPFRAIMNDMYARDISRKIRSVKHDKQRKGLFIGGKAVYGYRKHPMDKNRIIIDEPAADNVRRIFAMAAAGESCRSIADSLNAQGIPSPAVYAGLSAAKTGGGLWSAERIKELLQNRIYIGDMVQGRRVKLSYKSKKSRRQPEDSWIIVENTHEPIIDRDSFLRTGMLLNNRKRQRSRQYKHPLKGLVYCGECGRALTILNRKKTNGEDALYFICPSYLKNGRAGSCGSHCVKAETVADAVAETVMELCQPYLITETLLKEAAEFLAERKSAGDGKLQIQGKLDDLDRKLSRCYEDMLSGLIQEEDFKSFYAQLEAQRSELKAELKKLESYEIIAEPEERAEDLVWRFIGGIGSNPGFLTGLIERVEMSEDRELSIMFRFPPPEEGGSLL